MKQFALFVNFQNRKGKKEDRSETCLERIEDKPSRFGKSKIEVK